MSVHQKLFFEKIKSKLPANLSFVDEVAGALSLSNDSAYRRIRCESALTLDETTTLAAHFGVSLDGVFGSSAGSVPFRSSSISPGTYNLHDHLGNIVKGLNFFSQFPDAETWYNAMNVPPFQIFMVPELAQFLMYFWQRSIGHFAEFENKPFSFKNKDDKAEEMRKQILQFYIHKPVTEIWGEETMNSIIRQIEYYHEAEVFESKKDVVLLLEKLNDLILHVKREAELGYKFLFGKEPNGVEGNYKLYFNELALSDTTVLQMGGGNRMVYLVHNTVNFLTTSDPKFCDEVQEGLKRLVSQSTLISGASEKQRNRIFNRMMKRVEELKARANS